MSNTEKAGFFSHIRSRFERNRLGELLVQNGRLTPDQLRFVLKEQKKSGKTLGVVAQELGLVSKGQIRRTLFEQMAYRGIAASLTLILGLGSFGMISSAKASPNSVKNQYNQEMIHKASYGGLDQNIAKPDNPSQLFGSREVASSDISPFTKWTGVLKKLNRVSFKSGDTEKFRSMPLAKKVSAVNDYVNEVRYIEDKNNFGQSDYWATPAEFFARGGDCEDFAIAKYAILRELGVPESQMRLAIVQDKIKNIPHAILIVYTDTGPMMLDNQIKRASHASRINRYKPIYSINAEGWWRHLS